MTADRAALVEKVARVIETRQMDHFTIQASAAIDLIRAEVLEEAAGVCDNIFNREAYPEECAAAIRAMKEKPNDR
jgi:hypothetical protein